MRVSLHPSECGDGLRRDAGRLSFLLQTVNSSDESEEDKTIYVMLARNVISYPLTIMIDGI